MLEQKTPFWLIATVLALCAGSEGRASTAKRFRELLSGEQPQLELIIKRNLRDGPMVTVSTNYEETTGRRIYVKLFNQDCFYICSSKQYFWILHTTNSALDFDQAKLTDDFVDVSWRNGNQFWVVGPSRMLASSVATDLNSRAPPEEKTRSLERLADRIVNLGIEKLNRATLTWKSDTEFEAETTEAVKLAGVFTLNARNQPGVLQLRYIGKNNMSLRVEYEFNTALDCFGFPSTIRTTLETTPQPGASLSNGTTEYVILRAKSIAARDARLLVDDVFSRFAVLPPLIYSNNTVYAVAKPPGGQKPFLVEAVSNRPTRTWKRILLFLVCGSVLVAAVFWMMINYDKSKDI